MSTSFEKQPKTTSHEYVSIALYVACAIVQLSGLTVVAYQVGEPNFTFFTFSLTLIGTAVSYYLRRVGTTTKFLKVGAMLLALVFVYALRRATLFEMLVPSDSNTSQEMVLVCALAFTATLGSFLLITDDAVIFTCVWTIAIIGLTGTVNINRELPICFVVFLAAASFVLVHQNAISFGNDRTTRPDAGVNAAFTRWRLLRTHTVMALAAWSTAILLGALIAIPVQMVGRNMSLGTIIQRLHVPAGPSSRSGGGGSAHLLFDRLGEFNIGLGPVDDDPTERLSVLSDGPHYWRGRTYDSYSGHAWHSSTMMPLMLPRPTPLAPDANGMFTYNVTNAFEGTEPRRKTERIVADFQPSSGLIGPLFHAAEPVKVRIPVEQIITHLDGTISSARGNDPTAYQITSEVSVAKPSDLRKSSYQYPDWVAREYLNIDQFNDADQALEQAAVAGSPKNPFDRAGAIKRYIGSHCTYARDARAVPRDRDAVDFFLNDSHEGYCDLYATAMVVLCRYAGIPARVATGFAPGTAVARADDPNPPPLSDHRTRYVLRGDDLHAWAEVYFVGYGWIVFDPTEDTGGVAPAPKTPEPTIHVSPWKSFFNSRKGTLTLVGLGAFALLFAIGNEVRARWRANGGFHIFASRRRRSGAAVTAIYLDALRYVSRYGRVPRPSSMAPGEYVELVRVRLGETVADCFQVVTNAGQRALYGGDAVGSANSPESISAARTAFHNLKVAIKNRKRGREK